MGVDLWDSVLVVVHHIVVEMQEVAHDHGTVHEVVADPDVAGHLLL